MNSEENRINTGVRPFNAISLFNARALFLPTASMVLGLTFTILVFIASCSWRMFNSDDNYIQDVDQENDPFLSGNYTTGTATEDTSILFCSCSHLAILKAGTKI